MKKISVAALSEGVRFSKPLFWNANCIIVKENTVIREPDINKLHEWGIEELFTDGEEITDDTRPPETFSVNDRDRINFKFAYETAVDNVKDIFSRLNSHGNFDSMKLNMTSSKLIEEVKHNSASLMNLTNIASSTEDYLHYHSVNVCILSLIISETLGFTDKETEIMATGALLHDLGMLKIPKYIISKKETLTKEEAKKIWMHPFNGYQTISSFNVYPEDVALTAFQHHEQYDGNGYPQKLSGGKISKYARIAGIANVYDAMTKKRSYRDAFSAYDAVRQVLSGSQQQFDPEILKAFLSNISIYPIGTAVKLNSGETAVVVSVNKGVSIKPVVRLILSNDGKKIIKPKFLNLLENKNVFITGVVQPHKGNN